ncbi:BgtTE-56060 [Blumeria graminis f. sp. tritici]|uniref:BgtTE-56060 n=1 Tax=Blumeria graminis f. sp. tritici TaxID=62690 RepID=A0A9X9MHX9_BLUGR|nr:BgtTE-56060 [Blumeria graminis f. sp. tritici]
MSVLGELRTQWFLFLFFFFFAIFPGCHTPANGHRFVGWRGETMKGKGLLQVYDRMRTCEGWYRLRGAVWES